MSALTARGAVSAVRAAYQRLAQVGRGNDWITLRDQADAEADARAIDARFVAGDPLPLTGRTFAVKDNIDVAGLLTTAAHPAFAYRPAVSADCVQQLQAAGAVILGKTNMDQFATGLVGTRTPYGPVPSAVHPDRVAGGSSAGSATVVAQGVVDFALGTDTAGSGRVPAAFNAIIGIKPTVGMVSASGVVPACPSYDTVSVFTADLALGADVLRLLSSGTASRARLSGQRLAAPENPVLAVPRGVDLAILSAARREAFARTVERFVALGATIREIALTPFLEAAVLLYDGALVAERGHSFGTFLADHPEGADPTVATIAARAMSVTGPAVIADQQRLRTLAAAAATELGDADALLVPTVPEHPRTADVLADPFGPNTRLGTYTNFVNLLDLAAVAVPCGTIENEGEDSVTLVTRAFEDQVALDLAARLLGVPQPTLHPEAPLVAVFGAHMRDLPLNHELRALGARFVDEIRTAPEYRMYLTDNTPPRPILSPAADGTTIPGELWALSPAAVGNLLARIPAPLALGQVRLEDGRHVIGFLGTPTGVEEDITARGGWRSYLSARAQADRVPASLI